jgi:uncharacterized DUF497 family protein
MRIEWDPKKARSNPRKHRDSLKKAKPMPEDELRVEYKGSDFAGPMVRGKYAKRLRESSNIVVLKPEGSLS